MDMDNVNKKDIHVLMIPNNGKDVYYKYGLQHSFEKNETATMFYLVIF